MVICIHPSILTDITCPDTCETTVLKVRLLYMHLYHKPIPVLTCTPAPVNLYTLMYPCTLNRFFNFYSIKRALNTALGNEHAKIWPVDQAHAYCIRRGYTNQGSGWDWASCQQYRVAGTCYCACVATLIDALFIP